MLIGYVLFIEKIIKCITNLIIKVVVWEYITSTTVCDFKSFDKFQDLG